MSTSRPNVRHPNIGHPFSVETLDQRIGNRRDRHFLAAGAFQSEVFDFDDFWGDTINLDLYAVANGGGAAVASFATNVAEDGTIRATTGTAGNDTASASIIGPTIYKGDRNILFIARFKISAITEVRAEIGLIDVVPGSTKSAINSLVTPTVNTAVVDTALYVFDHTGSTTTSGFYTAGSSFTAQKTVGTTYALAADTYAVIAIELSPSNSANFFFNGVKAGAGHDNAVEGGDAVAFWARVSASNGTSKTMDIDYRAILKDRN